MVRFLKNEISQSLALASWPCQHHITTFDQGVFTYLAITMITLRGSEAIVKINSEAVGPKAINAHPKNSMYVMMMMIL